MPQSTPSQKLLLIDDDPVLLGLLSFRLKRALAECEIITSTEPEAVAGYDIYIIDNDFGGAHSGAKLAERLRLVAPDALILVFSSFLDVPLLKRVANIGADGVFDKRDGDDIERLLHVVSAHSDTQSLKKPSKTHILGDLFALLSVWNRKLAREEKARAAS